MFADQPYYHLGLYEDISRTGGFYSEEEHISKLGEPSTTAVLMSSISAKDVDEEQERIVASVFASGTTRSASAPPSHPSLSTSIQGGEKKWKLGDEALRESTTTMVVPRPPDDIGSAGESSGGFSPYPDMTPASKSEGLRLRSCFSGAVGGVVAVAHAQGLPLPRKNSKTDNNNNVRNGRVSKEKGVLQQGKKTVKLIRPNPVKTTPPLLALPSKGGAGVTAATYAATTAKEPAPRFIGSHKNSLQEEGNRATKESSIQQQQQPPPHSETKSSFEQRTSTTKDKCQEASDTAHRSHETQELRKKKKQQQEKRLQQFQCDFPENNNNNDLDSILMPPTSGRAGPAPRTEEDGMIEVDGQQERQDENGPGGQQQQQQPPPPRTRQPTPLFERLVTEEVQELKAYARIVESQQRRLGELERVHGDLEARLEVESRGRQHLETTLEAREREWSKKFEELQDDRDNWKDVVQVEETKNKRLIDQLNRKDQDIQKMIQRKYDPKGASLSVRNIRPTTSDHRTDRALAPSSKSPEPQRDVHSHKSPHEILAASGSAEKVRIRNVKSMLLDFFGV